MPETYTRDGETEFELVYEIPDDAADDHTVWLESEDDRVGVELAEFEEEWREWGYDDSVAQVSNEAKNAYTKARRQKGHGIN